MKKSAKASRKAVRKLKSRARPIKPSFRSTEELHRRFILRGYEPASDLMLFGTGHRALVAYQLISVHQLGGERPTLYYKAACSFCSPKDKFDYKHGRDLAIGRLQNPTTSTVLTVNPKYVDVLKAWCRAIAALDPKHRQVLGVPDSVSREFDDITRRFGASVWG